MIATLEAKTGESLSKWVERVRRAPVVGFGDVVKWLKEEHGLGHFQARLIVEASRKEG